MQGSLWSQTWLLVSLGMLSVFIFLLLLVQGLKMMSAYVNRAKKKEEEKKEGLSV